MNPVTSLPALPLYPTSNLPLLFIALPPRSTRSLHSPRRSPTRKFHHSFRMFGGRKPVPGGPPQSDPRYNQGPPNYQTAPPPGGRGGPPGGRQGPPPQQQRGPPAPSRVFKLAKSPNDEFIVTNLCVHLHLHLHITRLLTCRMQCRRLLARFPRRSVRHLRRPVRSLRQATRPDPARVCRFLIGAPGLGAMELDRPNYDRVLRPFCAWRRRILRELRSRDRICVPQD